MSAARRSATVVLGSLVALAAGADDARCACRPATPGGAEAGVSWVTPESAEDAAALEPWCAAVGAPLVTAPGTSPASGAPVGGLAVVVWNVHVGVAAVERLVVELRGGEWTGGRPVEHFVLLVQEALRVGGSVPVATGPGASSARAIGAPGDPSRSIDALATRLDLFAFYVPSMRNGRGHREDRGNAILSTLELRDLTAIELPYERQRRVAVAARVSIPSSDGTAPSLQLVNAHLDNGSRPSRFWRSFGAGRARQARALLAAVDGEEAVALGGDFNTWFGEASEEAIVLLRSHFPWPARLPASATYAPPYGLPERQVDYLMLRLPEGWEAGYRIAADRWDSDHAPLVGWIELPERGGPATRAGWGEGDP